MHQSDRRLFIVLSARPELKQLGHHALVEDAGEHVVLEEGERAVPEELEGALQVVKHLLLSVLAILQNILIWPNTQILRLQLLSLASHIRCDFCIFRVLSGCIALIQFDVMLSSVLYPKSVKESIISSIDNVFSVYMCT